MPVRSAGILLHRPAADGLDVWIAHMGGPFWAGKQEHAWSIPKGEYGDDESPWAAAVREFEEELGVPPPDAVYRLLGEFRQPSGKRLTVFAAAAPGFAPTGLVPGTFTLEWPPRSGRIREYPEVDDARWVGETEAREKLVRGQLPILDALRRRLAGR